MTPLGASSRRAEDERVRITQALRSAVRPGRRLQNKGNRWMRRRRAHTASEEQMSSFFFYSRLTIVPLRRLFVPKWLAVLLLRYRLYRARLKAGTSIFVVRAVVECTQRIATSAGPATLTILPSPPQIGNILIRAVSGALKSGAPLCGTKILGFKAAERPKVLIQGGVRRGLKFASRATHTASKILNSVDLCSSPNSSTSIAFGVESCPWSTCKI